MPKRPERLPSSLPRTYDLGFKNGAQHGFDELRDDALSWLQRKYIDDPNRPDRGTPKAEAIIDLARELSLYLGEVQLRKVK